MLYPIRLTSYEDIEAWELIDNDTVTDLATEVRSYYIPDFSNWTNNDSYQQALDHLLRDLKTDEG